MAKKILYYAPRIITAVLIIFLLAAIVGSSIIEGNYEGIFSPFLVGWLILLIVVAISWRFPKIGGVILIMLGIVGLGFIIIDPAKNGMFDIKPILIIGAPVIISGILFLREGVGKNRV